MLKVLDKVTADNVLKANYRRYLHGSYDINAFLFAEALMIFGRPSTTFSYNSRRVSLWVLQDQHKEKLFTVSMHRNAFNIEKSIFLPTDQRKFSNKLRNLDLKRATKLIEVCVRSLSPDNDMEMEYISRILDLFRSQRELIEDGTMEQEWFLLRDVNPIIEPIDKKVWVKDNFYILKILKELRILS